MAFRSSVVSLLFITTAFLARVHGATCPAPPTTVCNASAPKEGTGAAHCGDKGTADPPPKAVLRSSCFASFAPCRDACLANSQCVSFSTTTPNGGCILYSQGVEAIGFQAKASSSQRFYSRHCFTFDKGQKCPTGPSCPTVPTNFALQITDPNIPGTVYAKTGLGTGGGSFHIELGTGTSGRIIFNVANRDPVTCKGNLVVKDSDPPVYALGSISQPATRVVGAPEGLIAGDEKLSCSFGATLSCEVGDSETFADVGDVRCDHCLGLYDKAVFPDGFSTNPDITVKVVAA